MSSATFQNFFDRHHKFDTSVLLNFTPLNARQKEHLGNVYANLAISVLLTAAGVQFAQNILLIPTLLSFLGQLACGFYIVSTSTYRQTTAYRRDGSKTSLEDAKRLGAFCLLAFLTGTSIAPFLYYARVLSPSIVPTAFCATATVFACFSLGAVFAQERKFLYLGSILSSVFGYLALISLFNIFFQSKLAHDVILYGGLFCCLGFVLYDTQLILQECEMGYTDTIMHALTFYADVIGIFIRLVRIMMEKESTRQKENDRRR